MKTASVVLFATLLLSVGDAFLSYGMRSIDTRNIFSPAGFFVWFRSVVANGYVLVGVFFQFVFFLLFLVALAWADLSYVLPVTAASYVFTALLAKEFLNEQIGMLRWFGIVVIILGIVLIMLERQQVSAGLRG